MKITQYVVTYSYKTIGGVWIHNATMTVFKSSIERASEEVDRTLQGRYTEYKVKSITD